jgi:predicted metal-dependent HD superfamily phosphohydrolase
MKDPISKIKSFAEHQLSSLPDSFTFHNLPRTLKRIEASQRLMESSILSEEEKENVKIAIYLEDVGYNKDKSDPDQASKAMARELLTELGFDNNRVETILSLIRHQRIDQQPESEMDKVMKDADFEILASNDVFKSIEDLRKEFKMAFDQNFEDEEWFNYLLELFEKHQYHTAYALLNWEKSKKKNLKKLRKLQDVYTNISDTSLKDALGVDDDRLKKLKKKLKKVEGRSDRGIETMFRVTSRNHINLSAMADNKANILISVTSIIISILIGSLMNKLDSNPHLIMPTYFILFVNVITMIFAILATRPQVNKGVFTDEQLMSGRINLLFFGNFHKMEQDQYKEGMVKLMENGDLLYSSLIDDIYFNGKVLGRKYKLLRISYTIFMFGIVLSVIWFVIANYQYISLYLENS